MISENNKSALMKPKNENNFDWYENNVDEWK